MKDYKVDIKVRNNRIIKAIEESGGQVGQKWCKENEISYASLNSLINLERSPLRKNKVDLTTPAYKLCEVLNKSPNELWSDEQINPLQTNKVSIELKADQIKQLVNYEETDPTELFALAEMKNKMHTALDSLPKIERNVLKMRFFDNMTLLEIAEEIDRGPERVRQIEAKALRRLRHPTRSEDLGTYLR